jgi:hypothetical protein
MLCFTGQWRKSQKWIHASPRTCYQTPRISRAGQLENLGRKVMTQVSDSEKLKDGMFKLVVKGGRFLVTNNEQKGNKGLRGSPNA